MPSRSNWIESHADLRNHPKLKSTADELHIDPVQLCGHLHYLWHWVINYQEDGDVSRYSHELLADAGGWRGDCNQFVIALCNGYWLDKGPPLRVHNWSEYAGRLLKRRAEVRRNVEVFRAKAKGNQDTEPNRTQPNQTKRSLVIAFVPPTLDDAQTYFASKGVNGSEFQKFVMHYESKGWIVGKTKMKNWRAAAAGWIIRNHEGSAQ